MKLSKRVYVWAVLLILFNGFFLSEIIPPMSSPDEPQHLQRAYLLTKGHILLEAPEGMEAGGMFDTGLRDYINLHLESLGRLEHQLSSEQLSAADALRWTGEQSFLSTAGSGFYFPLIYAPQATGLWIGETFDLTIAHAYQLARYMSIVSIALVLLAAFMLYPVNPWVLACLFLPMTVFQFASASLDGVSTALSILAISIFLRLMDKEKPYSQYLFYTALAAIMLVATSRIHLFPLLLLPFILSFCRKSKTQFIASVLATGLVGAWIFIVMNVNKHQNIKDIIGPSATDLIVHYVMNPLEFFNILFHTITDADKVKFYAASFLGILGWLDVVFPISVYFVFLLNFLIVAGLSVSFRSLSLDKTSRWTLFISSMGSILLMFFIFLIVWNRFPVEIIEGVQGRYFLVPCILLAYACAGLPHNQASMTRWEIAFGFALLLECLSLVGTTLLMVDFNF